MSTQLTIPLEVSPKCCDLEHKIESKCIIYATWNGMCYAFCTPFILLFSNLFCVLPRPLCERNWCVKESNATGKTVWSWGEGGEVVSTHFGRWAWGSGCGAGCVTTTMHDTDPLSDLLVLCSGNKQANGEFPHKGTVIRDGILIFILMLARTSWLTNNRFVDYLKCDYNVLR